LIYDTPNKNERLTCNPDHVEEFKKQLTREVMIMTGEVGRLQKERQALEQQIADLFTFYAKQKSLTAGLVGGITGRFHD